MDVTEDCGKLWKVTEDPAFLIVRLETGSSLPPCPPRVKNSLSKLALVSARCADARTRALPVPRRPCAPTSGS